MSNIVKITIHTYVSNNNKYLKRPTDEDVTILDSMSKSIKVSNDDGSINKEIIRKHIDSVLRKSMSGGSRKKYRSTMKNKSNAKKNKSFKKYI